MRRRTPIVFKQVGLLVWAWVVVATFAFADVFEVGILLDPTTSDSTFMEGFQLAVDQSPDVSHPPGVEGGDHLGSMDVVMVVVDSAAGLPESPEPADFVTAAADLIGAGAAILVADVEPDVLSALFEPVTESPRMLFAMSDTGGAEFPETLFFFAATLRTGLETLLTDRTPAFEDAFFTAYDRSPSTAATRGYLAGRLVDLSVEATNRNPFDGQALTDGLSIFGDLAVPEPSADFDEDGDRDGLDFLTWQRGLGISSGAKLSDGDANEDGSVDQDDLAIWLQQMGSVSSQAAIRTVPEPSTWLLSICLLSVGKKSRKWRH